MTDRSATRRDSEPVGEQATASFLPLEGSEADTLPPAATAAYVSSGSATEPIVSDTSGVQPCAVPGYEILGELGRGGMGVVYKARHLKLQRLVALKMILAGSHAGSAELSRFRTEAEAIARLQHPNIVQVFEVAEHEGKPYFSLEFCNGGSLAQKIDGTPLPPKEAARSVETLARGMDAAHQKGIIHRDLKPANVLLLEDSTPKITDFGLAKKLDDVGQTQSGAIMGTPSYMAPEQAGGMTKEVGPAADIYALGAILYELLTGRPPFRAATPLDTVLQVVSNEPVPPTQLQSKTPKDVETICLKCLQKEPRKRYASAADLAEDLRRFQAGEPILARPVRWAERAGKWVRRHKGSSAGLGTAVLALLIGTGVATWFAIEAGVNADRADRSAEAARRQADAEAKAKVEAEVARGKEANARNEAEQEREEVRRQLDRARRFLCTTQLMQVAMVMERDPGRGLELLHDTNACPLDLRDFVWGCYEARCRRERHTCLLPTGTGAFRCMAFSPDSQLVAMGFLATITVCNVATGERKAVLKGHSDDVLSVAFSGDGHLLASGGRLGEVKVWNVVSGQVLAALEGHPAPVTSVAISRDGELVASASGSGITLWDVGTGLERSKVKNVTGSVRSVAFNPDGASLAWGDDGGLKLWDVATGKVNALRKGYTGRVAFSSDGRTLAAETISSIKLWDLPAGHERATLEGHTGQILSMAFSGDSRMLVSGSSDKTIKLWDVASGQEKSTFRGHSEGVGGVAFDGADKFLVSASKDKTIKTWDVAGRGEAALQCPSEVFAVACSRDGKLIASGGNPPQPVTVWDVATGKVKLDLGSDGIVWSLAFSGDGKMLAIGSNEKTVKVWDLTTGQLKVTLTGHSTAVRSVAFSADGKLLASVAQNLFQIGSPESPGEVKVWDIGTGQQIAALKGHTGSVTSLAFSPNGRTLALGYGGYGRNSGETWGVVKLWDLDSDRHREFLDRHRLHVTSVAFSGDGKLLASSSGMQNLQDRLGEVKVWDVASGREKVALVGHTGLVTSVAFTGDGKLLASGGYDRTIKVWDVATSQVKASLKGHGGGVTSVAFSGDGKLLASGSWDKTIKVWEAAADEGKASLRGHTEPVYAVAFSTDSKLLSTAGNDTTVKLWDASTGEQRASLKGHGGPVFSVAFSADGKLLASGGEKPGEVKIWNLATGQEKATLRGHTGHVYALAFSADGRALSSGSGASDSKAKKASWEVKVWDVATGLEKSNVGGSIGSIRSMAFSSDRALLAIGGVNDQTVTLWELANGQQKAVLSGRLKWTITSLAFSTDGRLLASGGGPMRVWDLSTQRVRNMQGAAGNVTSVAFSRDGKLLAGATSDRTIKVWDVASGEEKAALKGHSHTVHNVAFRGDGKVLASAGGDLDLTGEMPFLGEVLRWDLNAVPALRPVNAGP